MNKLLVVILLLASAAGSSAAQNVPASDADSVKVPQSVYVRISTNVDDAVLFADTVLIGGVPSDYVVVPSGTDRLRLTVQDANTWSVPPVETKLHAADGDSVEIELHFPHHYRIESIPFGANVHLEGGEEWNHLGTTPLLHTTEAPLEGRIVVGRPGYAMERVEPGRDVWNRHVVMLKPSDNLDPTAAQVNWQPPKKRRAWIDYAALSTAVAAGAVAVHYKFKADDLYAAYEDTADSSLRDDIHAHDVRSGVAFGVMQAGLGIFAIRLVLR